MEQEGLDELLGAFEDKEWQKAAKQWRKPRGRPAMVHGPGVKCVPCIFRIVHGL